MRVEGENANNNQSACRSLQTIQIDTITIGIRKFPQQRWSLAHFPHPSKRLMFTRAAGSWPNGKAFMKFLRAMVWEKWRSKCDNHEESVVNSHFIALPAPLISSLYGQHEVSTAINFLRNSINCFCDDSSSLLHCWLHRESFSSGKF